MFTAPKTGSIGQRFIKAPNDSAFGKVFHNNMDWNSFIASSAKIKKHIATMVSNSHSKTAMFDMPTRISETQEYRNCSVSKQFIYFLY